MFESKLSISEVLSQFIEKMLMNSKCATDAQMKEFLFKILGNKQLVTTMLFRASEDGWSPEDFHSRCDKKGPTLSLFKIQDGDCIGGYTAA
jgi:hypothetical protein